MKYEWRPVIGDAGRSRQGGLRRPSTHFGIRPKVSVSGDYWLPIGLMASGSNDAATWLGMLGVGAEVPESGRPCGYSCTVGVL